MRGHIGGFLAPDIHFAGLELLFAIVARRKVFIGVLSQGNGGNRSVIIAFDLGDDLERVRQLRHREQPDADLANEASTVGTAHWVVRSRNTKPGSRLASLRAAANVQEQVGQRFRPHAMPIVFNEYTLEPRSIGLDYDAARIGVISIGNQLSKRRTWLPVDAVGDARDHAFISFQGCLDNVLRAVARPNRSDKPELVVNLGHVWLLPRHG